MKQFWNDKHPKKPIIYQGRAIRGCEDRINVDVRNMIWEDDRMLSAVTNTMLGSNDDKALSCQRYVVSRIKYVSDKTSANIEECWQYPNETLTTCTGDCEDGAILMASLMLNAGVPEWRVRVTAGIVQASPTAETGGHAYVTYCRESDNNWVVLDWCYLEDSKYIVQAKPLFKEKSQYKAIWFSFNNLYSWAHEDYGVIGGIK